MLLSMGASGWLRTEATYLTKHERVEGQGEGQQQEEEEHDNADEGAHDFPEHNHVDPEMFKSAPREGGGEGGGSNREHLHSEMHTSRCFGDLNVSTVQAHGFSTLTR